MSGTNGQVVQGTLNRLLTQLTLSSFPALNVGRGYFGKSFMRAALDGPLTTQQETGTGFVNSPEPYVPVTFTFGVLRTQSLSAAWASQIQAGTVLGTAIGYPDSAAFPSISLSNASVTAFDLGGWDGTDAVVSVTIRGVWYINSSAWV